MTALTSYTDSAGIPRPIRGVALLNPDGSQATISGGAGGGSTGAQATAAAPTYTEGTFANLSQDLAGSLRITAAQLPASLGAKTAANSISIVPGTGSSFAVTGTFFQATQPVSAAVGAIVAGAYADGAVTTIGATADAAWSGTGAGSVVSVLKGIYAGLVAPTPTGTNTIGTVLVATSSGAILSNNISSDAVSASASAAAGLNVRSHGYLFNGSTWDRQRGDLNGALNQPYALTASRWQYAGGAGGIVNTTTAVTIMGAAGAGVRNYCLALQIDYDALTTATEVAIRDGAAGTVIWRGKLPSGAAGSRSIQFPLPLKGTANTLMEFVTLTASGAGGVYVSAQGYQGS